MPSASDRLITVGLACGVPLRNAAVTVTEVAPASSCTVDGLACSMMPVADPSSSTMMRSTGLTANPCAVPATLRYSAGSSVLSSMIGTMRGVEPLDSPAGMVTVAPAAE